MIVWIILVESCFDSTTSVKIDNMKIAEVELPKLQKGTKYTSNNEMFKKNIFAIFIAFS